MCTSNFLKYAFLIRLGLGEMAKNHNIFLHIVDIYQLSVHLIHLLHSVDMLVLKKGQVQAAF